METIDVASVIDEAPVGGMQRRTMALCALVAFLDGFDAQTIGPVAPVIAQSWGVRVDGFGLVFSAGLMGLTCGALFFGPVADRIGRKAVLIGSTLLFGLCTLLTVNATDVAGLVAYRFATGIGLGGAMPNTIALTAEFAPTRLRAMLVSMMFIGFPLGSVVGGLSTVRLVASFGWQGVFAVGGALPLALVPLLVWQLPESLRFLVTREQSEARIRATLHRLRPGRAVPAEARFVVPERGLSGVPVQHLFRDGRGRGTVLLWTAFFMNLLVIYFVVSWLPTILQRAGLPLPRAILVATLFNVGGMVGGVVIGRRADRSGPYGPIAAAFVGGAVFLAAIGVAGTSLPLLIAAILVAGFGITGAQFGINALAANVYPTAVRSTGVSWGLGIGRIGSIIGPFLGGFLLRLEVSPDQIFFLVCLPALIAGGAIFLMRASALAGSTMPAVE